MIRVILHTIPPDQYGVHHSGDQSVPGDTPGSTGHTDGDRGECRQCGGITVSQAAQYEILAAGAERKDGGGVSAGYEEVGHTLVTGHTVLLQVTATESALTSLRSLSVSKDSVTLVGSLALHPHIPSQTKSSHCLSLPPVKQ